MSDFFILRNKEPAPATTREWASWFEKTDRVLLCAYVAGACVSTTFIGAGGVMWETHIDGGKQSGWTKRSDGVGAARLAHLEAVDMCLEEDVVGYKLSIEGSVGWKFAGSSPSEVATTVREEIFEHEEHPAEEHPVITLTPYSTTREEFEELPEFEGW